VVCHYGPMPPATDDSWDRITAWLSRHAPPLAATVNPPATEAAIAEAEAAVGTPLPADLLAWWRRADGMRWVDPHAGWLIPPHFIPHPIDRALESRRIWLDVMESCGAESEMPAGPAGSESDVWLPDWMPIGADGGGRELFVDLRDGPQRGCVMEYDKVGAAEGPPSWPSVAAMLAEIADALEHDTPIDGNRIWVDDDGTTSWDSDSYRWSMGGSAGVNFARLRERYAAFAAEAHAGGFAPPPAGAWSAEQVAAHVVRNTELLIAATEAVLATKDWARFKELQRAAAEAAEPIRYDNSDAMDPVVLDRYAADGLAALAERADRLGQRLCELAEPLNRGRPGAYVRIVDGGATIVDGPAGWLGVLNALWIRQLPLRTRQLRALRTSAGPWGE
jgi:cell wall assembly regulator SMI1